ncbi:hypothetical protein [Rubellimicrobium arenae]|uniref:hypothetical protein n=1 Tax=Rubellimicrobium arenae TaxID=2817372 RepID=UPI001B300F5F|nr:hypothetical protein [Rubellimicrobium arenae]
MARIDMTPPATVAREAAKGLKLHETFNRGGTEVGWARARQLRDRKELSRDDVVAMASYFARHEVDKRGHDWGNEENPSAGYIAWLLWGGEPGRDWAETTKARLQEAEGKEKD